MSAKRIIACAFAVALFFSVSVAFALDEEKFFVSPPSSWEQFSLSPSVLRDAAEATVKGNDGWLMRTQYRFLRRFNLLNPTPIGAAQSMVDVGIDATFHLSDADETKENARKERYRLAKARHIYRQLQFIFPYSPEAKQVEVRIGELTKRLQELDAKFGNRRGLDEKLFMRPVAKSFAWAAVGDRPWRDLVSVGSVAPFAGPGALIMGGAFWGISAGQRFWALHDHGGLTPEEQNRLMEFLAAETRVLLHEKKQEAEEALLALYEQQGTIGALAKAVDRYAVLMKESPEVAERYREKFKKTREQFADALLSYAEEKGDAATYYMLSGEFSDTPAGIKAAEQIEKKGIPKPQLPKLREAHINAGAGGSGFDFSGGGSAGGYRFDAGIMNASQPYGEAAIPWNIPGLKGTPAISGGPGRLSLFLMLDKHFTPSDAELFE